MGRRLSPELRADMIARAPSPTARALLEKLLAADAGTRTRGLDALSDALLRGQGPDEGVVAAALALATDPRGYPEASALLVRLLRVLAAIDDPPRSGPPADARARASWDRVRLALPGLLRLARRASDPQAARAATLMASRFPEVDAETEPLLIALASGAPDADERARLLYALARIQAAHHARFHGAIAEALSGGGGATRLGVALALVEHDPPSPLRERLVEALREVRDAASPSSDPRAWGRTLGIAELERAIARLSSR